MTSTPFTGLVQVRTAVAKPLADTYIQERIALEDKAVLARRTYIDSLELTWWGRLQGDKYDYFNRKYRWDWTGVELAEDLQEAGLITKSEYMTYLLGKRGYIYDLANLCSVGSEYVWVTPDQAAFIGNGGKR